MASEIRVNSINNRSGLGTVTIADSGIVVSGLITATTFSGNVTGNLTGNVTGDVNAGVITATSLNTTGNVEVGTGVTIYASSGIVSATTFYGDASGLTNVPAGSSLTGNFTITNGNVVVSNGYGIDFSATSGTGTSELFDDYEEGTWTPQLTGSSGGAYTMSGSNNGTYTKVGRVVTVSAVLQWSGGGPYSGNLLVTGLPFANNSSNRAVNAFGHSSGSSIVPNGSYTWLTVGTDVTASVMYIGQNGTSGHNFTPTVASSGVVFALALTYLTN